MSDPALGTARHALRSAHKAVEERYIRWLSCAHDHRRAREAALNLSIAALNFADVLLELELVRPVGGERHVPPGEAA